LNPPPGYIDELGDLPEGIELTDQPEGAFDFVHLFVKSKAQLEELGPTAFEAVKHDGLLWVSYPKGSSKLETDLKRDVVWEVVTKISAGELRPVTQVSVDQVWSALRFRPTEKVGR
jgi:hypothetical protein